jgi:hypothetical protein
VTHKWVVVADKRVVADIELATEQESVDIAHIKLAAEQESVDIADIKLAAEQESVDIAVNMGLAVQQKTADSKGFEALLANKGLAL